MLYLKKYNLLICSQCKIVLLKDTFKVHLKRQHKLKILAKDEKIIINSCFMFDSPYLLNPSEELLEPIPIFPVYRGFKCESCFYCCQLKRTITTHLEKFNHGIFSECVIQRLPGKISNIFFGVTNESHELNNEVVDLNQMDMNLILQDFQKLVFPSTSSIKHFNNYSSLNLFYQKLAWHVNDDEIDSEIFNYCIIPKSTDELYQVYEKFIQIYLCALSDVSQYDVTIRSKFRDNHKVFIELNESSKVFFSFIFKIIVIYLLINFNRLHILELLVNL